MRGLAGFKCLTNDSKKKKIEVGNIVRLEYIAGYLLWVHFAEYDGRAMQVKAWDKGLYWLSSVNNSLESFPFTTSLQYIFKDCNRCFVSGS